VEALLVYDGRWIGRPLTRDDEGHRVIAQTTKRQTNSQSRDEERRVVAQTRKRQPSSWSLDTAKRYAVLAEFTGLFVLGMFIGSAAVLIAFML
jgi:hypothetical protein